MTSVGTVVTRYDPRTKNTLRALCTYTPRLDPMLATIHWSPRSLSTARHGKITILSHVPQAPSFDLTMVQID
jgi:hypothetical protein